MGFEPTTFCLGSKHSTAELRPLAVPFHYSKSGRGNGRGKPGKSHCGYGHSERSRKIEPPFNQLAFGPPSGLSGRTLVPWASSGRHDIMFAMPAQVKVRLSRGKAIFCEIVHPYRSPPLLLGREEACREAFNPRNGSQHRDYLVAKGLNFGPWHIVAALLGVRGEDEDVVDVRFLLRAL